MRRCGRRGCASPRGCCRRTARLRPLAAQARARAAARPRTAPPWRPCCAAARRVRVPLAVPLPRGQTLSGGRRVGEASACDTARRGCLHRQHAPVRSGRWNASSGLPARARVPAQGVDQRGNAQLCKSDGLRDRTWATCGKQRGARALRLPGPCATPCVHARQATARSWRASSCSRCTCTCRRARSWRMIRACSGRTSSPTAWPRAGAAFRWCRCARPARPPAPRSAPRSRRSSWLCRSCIARPLRPRSAHACAQPARSSTSSAGPRRRAVLVSRRPPWRWAAGWHASTMEPERQSDLRIGHGAIGCGATSHGATTLPQAGS